MALQVAQLFSSTYGLSVTGFAAEVPERNILHPFAYFSICEGGRTIVTRRVEVPEAGIREDQLGVTLPVLALRGAPADTIAALRIQLWFTRLILEAFTTVLAVGMTDGGKKFK